MEQDITKHLQELFNPVAIILHGSRASGHERLHSDWDFVLIYEVGQEVPTNGRGVWNDQNIEFTHHVLPIKDPFDEFGVKLQNARVVFESHGEATDVLERIQNKYKKPLGWNQHERTSHALWMQGRIEGMVDCIDNSLLFEKYAADFYARITNYWYWAKHNRFAQPMYKALEEIAENDPEYVALIEQFVAEPNRAQRVAAAKAIMQACFGEDGK